MNKKRILAGVFALAMMVPLGATFSCNYEGNNLMVSAENVDYGTVLGTGECGKNVIWTAYGTTNEWNEDHIDYLVISGTGAIYDDFNILSNMNIDNWSGDTSIIIEEGITKIGSYAFWSGHSGVSPNYNVLSLPNTLESIGDYAFYITDSNFDNINIPASVSYISPTAFSSRINSFTVESNNKNYTAQDGVLFSKDMTTLIAYPTAKNIDGYSIPNTVTNIYITAFRQYRFESEENFETDVTLTIPNANVQFLDYTIEENDAVSFYKPQPMTLETPAYESFTIYGVAGSPIEAQIKEMNANKTKLYENYWDEVQDIIFNPIKTTTITTTQSVTNSNEKILDQGVCDNFTWKIIDTGDILEDTQEHLGHLIVEGTGKISSLEICEGYCNIGISKDEVESIEGIPISKMTIGEGITTIGDSACNHAVFLKELNLPSTLKSIGRCAFRCSMIDTVYIPKSVTFIGDSAFGSTAKEFVVDKENPSYTSIDGVLFTKDKKTLVQYPALRKLDGYVVPDTTTAIYNSAFSGFSPVNYEDNVTITILKSVKEIIKSEPEWYELGIVQSSYFDNDNYNSFTIKGYTGSFIEQYVINANKSIEGNEFYNPIHFVPLDVKETTTTTKNVSKNFAELYNEILEYEYNLLEDKQDISNGEVGYFLYDINKDGIKELIVSTSEDGSSFCSSNHVYYIYTIKNGEVIKQYTENGKDYLGGQWAGFYVTDDILYYIQEPGFSGEGDPYIYIVNIENNKIILNQIDNINYINNANYIKLDTKIKENGVTITTTNNDVVSTTITSSNNSKDISSPYTTDKRNLSLIALLGILSVGVFNIVKSKN